MEQDVITLDPHQHDDSVTHSVLSNVFDSLVAFDGSMRVVPALATSWENPTDLIWRFHLRSKVTFHDGRPLTAADVKYSLERAGGTKVAHYLAAISKVETLDEETFEIHTRSPEPVLLNKLAVVAIVPAGTPLPLSNAVGTGAYRVAGYRKGHVLELVANGAFWGGRPAIQRALVKVVPDSSERARALVRREILLAREVAEKDLAGAGGAHVRFLSEPGLTIVFLGINFRVPGPLRSVEVRRAIFWALDPREIIRESGLEGAPSDQLVPPSVFGFVPRPEAGRPRPELAKELLEKAGYPDGFDVTLEMPRTAAEKTGAILKRQLARVGIRLEVAGLEWSELSSHLDTGRSPFYSIGWACYGDASDLLDAMLHTKVGTTYGSANFGGYGNAAMDEAIERAGRILDPNTRLEALQQAMRTSLDELPLIPLYRRNRTYGADRSVRFVPRQNGQVKLFEISWTGSSAPPPDVTRRP